MAVAAKNYCLVTVGLASNVMELQASPVGFAAGYTARITCTKALERSVLSTFKVRQFLIHSATSN
jgi:hypothetical protein